MEDKSKKKETIAIIIITILFVIIMFILIALAYSSRPKQTHAFKPENQFIMNPLIPI